MNMNKKIDDKSNTDVAERVIAPKRKYFSPTTGMTVDAASADEAVKIVNKLKKDAEVGDGEL